MHRGTTIPALPCRDVAASAAYYVDRFGFTVVHQDEGFAVLNRDSSRIHLWQSGDDGWSARRVEDLQDSPVRTGAETFLAGTASCRIEVDSLESVDQLFVELAATGVLHPGDPCAPTEQDGPTDTDFGTREFATLDLDGNLLEFFRWR
jgi:catechol 2,3-dioxygenase-like lactoylglutathione lyase family enzyme